MSRISSESLWKTNGDSTVAASLPQPPFLTGASSIMVVKILYSK